MPAAKLLIFSWFVLLLTVLVAGAAEDIRLANPFPYAYPRQPVTSTVTVEGLLPARVGVSEETLNQYLDVQEVGSGAHLPAQWSEARPRQGKVPARATVQFLTDLPGKTTKTFRIVRRDSRPGGGALTVTRDPDTRTVTVHTGQFGVRLPDEGAAAPPVLAVCRWADGEATPAWRGSARFVETGPLAKMTVTRSAAGPVFYRQTMTYTFALGTVYRCEVTCWAGEDYLTVREWTEGPGSERMRWEFDFGAWSARLLLSGHGHGFGYSEVKLDTLAPREEIAWLPNYVIWGVPYEAMLACVAPAAADGELFGFFQVRRGEWEDLLFAPIATTPLSAHPETAWSQKRWWGSRFSALRLARNEETGVLASLNLAPGRREWGLALGKVNELPVIGKSLKTPPPMSQVKTAIGELRLTEVQDYILDWQPDPKVTHPRVEMTAAMLDGMAARAATDPYLQQLYDAMKNDPVLVAWRTRDAAQVNKLAKGIVKDLQERYVYSCYNGLEFSSFMNPVASRSLFQTVTKADILLGTGLVEPAVQQQLRANFAFLAYRFADSSFMAWKYNAGHPNFDADRYATIAAIAMLYPDHPMAKTWLRHAVDRLHESMRLYTLPESGKWAENVGCYYFWSATVLSGLARALKFTGAADPYAWPEFRTFWRWSVMATLPPKPAMETLSALCAGTPSAFLTRQREQPAPGDHGRDGGYPIHGGIALSGVGILPHDPALGKTLLSVWLQGGKQPVDHYPYSLFFALDAKTLALAKDPAAAPVWTSQRLQGYGAVLRAAVGSAQESYLLFKCGPGGYRYHGEEGSFVLFGLGQPLTLDGGENIRPDQHSTVTFGAEGWGLRRGRVVQFASGEAVDYVCGRFPGTPEEVLPEAQRPAWPKTGHTWNFVYGLASPETNMQQVRKVNDDDLGLLAYDATFAGERDVLTRQLLFRKNRYLVIRDEIDSLVDSQWHLQLFAQSITRQGGLLRAKGWLGVDAAVALYRIAPATGALTPVSADEVAITPEPIKWGRKDEYVFPQQHLTLKQPAGVGVMAVIYFLPAGSTEAVTITPQGNDLQISAEGTREMVRLRGRGIPQAAWTIDGTTTAWAYQQPDPALPPIAKAEVKAGMVYVNGTPFLGDGWNTSKVEGLYLTPGGLLRWPNGNFLRAAQETTQGKAIDLAKTEPLIEGLEQSGKYAVLIIEPYWGQRVDKWSQLSWRGENRGGAGLNTNACWRNPEFIADRLQKVRDVIAMVKKTPRAHARILGYIVWNEQRWAWGDETCYCPHCRKAWGEWLAKQYGTLAALNRAYDTHYTAFGEVPMPTPVEATPVEEQKEPPSRPVAFTTQRQVTNEAAWRDFHLFKADGLIAFEKAGAAAAKAADPSRLVITSIFARDVHPNIGHVMLRLYRELGADPHIDIIGGNTYDVLPTTRANRHVEMWRSMPAAHAKPVWFTEFNSMGGDMTRPPEPADVRALLAHTAFSGCSGVLWYTDREKGRLGVLEADGTTGRRYQEIAEANALREQHRDLIVQAARNTLPAQVAIIHPDAWNALADNEYYNTASLAAQHAFGQWAGFATTYLAEPEIRAGALRRYPVAVLWQAQRQADLPDDLLVALRRYVEGGGTLLCDLPVLQGADGVGPAGGWAALLGFTASQARPRMQLALDDPRIGTYAFTVAGDAFPGREEQRDLGQWEIAVRAGTQVIPDTAGQPAILVHPVGRGRVITCAFRPALVNADPTSQVQRALLLQRLVAMAGTTPLVDAPWLEKTIAPLDRGGLLVTAYNPREVAVSCPLRLPRYSRATLTPVRLPVGAAVNADHMVVPAGEWVVFTVTAK